MRVLIVEDDQMIGEAIVQALKDAAYAVEWVSDGETALTAVSTRTHDVVLLDLGLPGKDGLDVLAALRADHQDIPVLVVTARDALEARIQGLDLGADDYLVKPFELGELLARIRAVLRRKGGNALPVMSNGKLSLDPVTREASLNNITIRLSNREFALLRALLIRPGAILSRQQLESRIYAWDEEIDSNAVEFLIHSIRKKLGGDAIKNVRGLGWMVDRSA